jgi:hypothetical protein
MTKKSLRDHIKSAKQVRILKQSPPMRNYEKETTSKVRKKYTDKGMDYYIDVLSLLEKCDSTGYLAPYMMGLAWDQVPKTIQGQISADIRKFRKKMREGGYPVE